MAIGIEHIIAFALCFAQTALFGLMAWKYHHGQWLRSIAGNNFVSNEDYNSPEQRRLGKRMSVAMVFACLMTATLTCAQLGTMLENEVVYASCMALTAATTALLVLYLVWLFAVMWRERRAAQNALMATDPSRTEDVKLDRRATVVLLIVLLVYLLIVFVVPRFASS